MAEPAAQSDDCYSRIFFRPLAGGDEAEGTVGWREGAENRVVFQVWDGPSFAAEGPDLAAAFAAARAGIMRAGFTPLAPSDDALADLFAGADAKSPPRIQPLLWLVIAVILLALMVPVLARAEIPALGAAAPFPDAPYEWQLDATAGTGFVLTIREADGRGLIARYDLDLLRLCEGAEDNCERDGIFPLALAGMAREPVLAAIGHIGAHGQKLSIFRPLYDDKAPVFEAVADYALDLRLRRDGLDVTVDRAMAGGGANRERLHWPAAPARAEPADITLPQAPPLSRSAAAFDERLRNIAAARDVAGFVALLTDDVLVSFGGNGGKAEFAEHWQLKTEPGRALFWATLDRLLAQGGWNEAGDPEYGQRLTWPWFFAAWPGDADAENAFVANEDTALRAAPDTKAPVLARLPRAAVLLGGAEEGGEVFGRDWLEVVATGGALGFVRHEDVTPLLDTRMLAVETGTGWRIEAMVAGD